MPVIEIVAGVLVLLVCIAITVLILAQDSKGGGLSSVITGTEMMSGETRSRSKEARQARLTKILAVVFFAVVVLANVLSAMQS